MGEGITPTVEEAATAAGVGRTTAYRYFPTQDALVRAAHPQLDAVSLLGPDPPTDVTARFERVLAEQVRIVRQWDPQLRASLRLSLQPGAPRSPLRGGRAVGWFVDALAPLADAHPDLDLRLLAVHLRSVVGVEPYVWLRDVAGLDVDGAIEVMRTNARLVLSGLLAPPTAEATATAGGESSA
jgi:AcrR family transcriptional regulator